MNELTVAADRAEIMESVIIKGDLSKLSPEERSRYYLSVCESMGVNPLTRPFEYITLNGKLQLYAKRDAADQLRKINGVNIKIVDKRIEAGLFMVTVQAADKHGRIDEDMGVVAIPQGGAGEIRANAMLKAITKAKRRVTLSICGLGFLDETEIEDIPAAAKSRHRQSSQVTVVQSTSPSETEWVEGGAATVPDPAGAPVADPPEPESGAPATHVPTAAEYVARWSVMLDEATQADQIGPMWAADKQLRRLILWPEDGTFDKLKQRVEAAVAELKAADKARAQ